MSNKEQIQTLITKYKTELKDIRDELSQIDKSYTRGYYNGKTGVLEWVIRDLEKLLRERDKI